MLYRKFKRTIIFILLSLWVVQLSTISVQSIQNVSFYMQTDYDKIAKNRLFLVDTVAFDIDNSDLYIGVFSMEIDYNPEILEFKRIFSENDSVKIKYSIQSSGKIKMIYLNSSGTMIKDDTKLFSIEFKMLSEDNTNISANIYDAYDVNANYISDYKIKDIAIYINKNSSEVEKNNSKSDNADTYVNSNTIKNINDLNSKDNYILVFLLGMLVMIVIFIFGFICYNIGKNNNKK